jgi:hypothetical protein
MNLPTIFSEDRVVKIISRQRKSGARRLRVTLRTWTPLSGRDNFIALYLRHKQFILAVKVSIR